MQKAHIVSLLVMVMLGMACADITHDFYHGVHAMIGPDLDTSPWIAGIDMQAGYVPLNEPAHNLEGIIANPDEWVPGWGSHRWTNLRPLRFGNHITIRSLTFVNRVNQGQAQVMCFGTYATKVDGQLQIRSGYGLATGRLHPQHNVQVHRVCHKKLFGKKCHDQHIAVPRGFHHHELEAITTQLKRHAAYALFKEVGARNGLGALPSTNGLANIYLDESNRLRTLYTEIRYEWSEVYNIAPHEIVHYVHHGSAHLIGDHNVLNRISDVARGNGHSCFLVFPHGQIFFAMCLYNHGHALDIKLSTITVAGQLPVGAFATSVGGWNLELGGQGASPSIHQILGIFPPLK